MKSLFRGIKAALFAFTAILCGNAFGATPVAVWDGDFNTTTKGEVYTLNLSTHTKAEDGSKVTISATPTPSSLRRSSASDSRK